MNSTRVEDHSISIWSAAWKLLRLRATIQINNFRRSSLKQKIGIGFIGVIIIGLLAFAFTISLTLLQALQSPMTMETFGDYGAIVQIIPTILLSGAFFGILVTSFGLLLQALYLAGDMDFLLAAPIPIRSVFIAKLLQAILPNFTLICAFALPVLFGLGASQGYSIIYYPLVLVMLAALSLAAAGLSSLMVMLAARIFPARRMVEVLGFIGAITSIVCSQSGQFARYEDFSANQAGQVFQMASTLARPWSPLTWAGESLTAVGQGLWLVGTAKTLLTLGLAGAIFALSLTIAERLYYSGWASIQGQKRKKKAQHPVRQTRTTRFPSFFEPFLPQDLRAIIRKDILILQRDLRNLSQLVTPLIFGIIYTVLFLQDGGEMSNGQGEAPEFLLEAIKNLSVYFNVAISLFVGWMLLNRLGGMGFSQEGRSYWLLKTAPISVQKLITAKFLVAYLPTLALSLLFLILVWLFQGAPAASLVYSLPVVALCIAGSAGLSLTFGITGAKLDWEDPRQMQKTGSGCLGTLISSAFLPISLFLFFAPLLAAQLLDFPIWAGQILGLILGGVFSLACAILPLRSVRAAVIRLGE